MGLSSPGFVWFKKIGVPKAFSRSREGREFFCTPKKVYAAESEMSMKIVDRENKANFRQGRIPPGCSRRIAWV
jgi:hypothetical protein